MDIGVAGREDVATGAGEPLANDVGQRLPAAHHADQHSLGPLLGVFRRRVGDVVRRSVHAVPRPGRIVVASLQADPLASGHTVVDGGKAFDDGVGTVDPGDESESEDPDGECSAAAPTTRTATTRAAAAMRDRRRPARVLSGAAVRVLALAATRRRRGAIRGVGHAQSGWHSLDGRGEDTALVPVNDDEERCDGVDAAVGGRDRANIEQAASTRIAARTRARQRNPCDVHDALLAVAGRTASVGDAVWTPTEVKCASSGRPAASVVQRMRGAAGSAYNHDMAEQVGYGRLALRRGGRRQLRVGAYAQLGVHGPQLQLDGAGRRQGDASLLVTAGHEFGDDLGLGVGKRAQPKRRRAARPETMRLSVPSVNAVRRIRP